ncbi:hypothetical protein [Pantoea sp. GbtcB22]|uniref:hypothetical protein n=1 Tax=Pantoea sp. GbtcB22 TaxID=2824767 RepID=UPI001C2F725A|nr:hypothetical protein [Pantoea sp. GbtcB22]
MTNQQLKARCEDVIANPQDHLDWVVDIARVALARLEAVPADRVVDDGCNQHNGEVQVSDKINYVWPVGTQFYTAPPVPELKPIDLTSCRNLWYDHDDLSAEVKCIPVKDIKKAIRAAGYEVKS